MADDTCGWTLQPEQGTVWASTSGEDAWAYMDAGDTIAYGDAGDSLGVNVNLSGGIITAECA